MLFPGRFPPAQTKAVCTLENNPRQPSDCAIYVFMKIDDDEATSSANATSGSVVFSQNEQVMVCEDGAAQMAGIVVANESGGIAGDKNSNNNSNSDAMETDGSSSNGSSASDSSSSAASTYAVRVVGEAQPRTGVSGAVLMNIRQQWVADFGTDTKVSVIIIPFRRPCVHVVEYTLLFNIPGISSFLPLHLRLARFCFISSNIISRWTKTAACT